MTIPSHVRDDAEAALAEFCREHSTGAVSGELRYAYTFAPNAALLIEQRPSFMKPSEWTDQPVAKFRYSEARNEWSLYWIDKSGRWRKVPDVHGEADIRPLLKVVLADPLGVFWG